MIPSTVMRSPGAAPAGGSRRRRCRRRPTRTAPSRSTARRRASPPSGCTRRSPRGPRGRRPSRSARAAPTRSGAARRPRRRRRSSRPTASPSRGAPTPRRSCRRARRACRTSAAAARRHTSSAQARLCAALRSARMARPPTAAGAPTSRRAASSRAGPVFRGAWDRAQFEARSTAAQRSVSTATAISEQSRSAGHGTTTSACPTLCHPLLTALCLQRAAAAAASPLSVACILWRNSSPLCATSSESRSESSATTHGKRRTQETAGVCHAQHAHVLGDAGADARVRIKAVLPSTTSERRSLSSSRTSIQEPSQRAARPTRARRCSRRSTWWGGGGRTRRRTT